MHNRQGKCHPDQENAITEKENTITDQENAITDQEYTWVRNPAHATGINAGSRRREDAMEKTKDYRLRPERERRQPRRCRHSSKLVLRDFLSQVLR